MPYRLNQKLIDEFVLPANLTRKKLTDGDGLYLLVTQAGKYWRYNYRYYGKGKTLALGVYPQITINEARSAHQIAQNHLAKGEDPAAIKAAQRKDEKQLLTVNQQMNKRLGRRAVTVSEADYLFELESQGIGFYFNQPNVPDTNGFVMTALDLIKFCEDPVLFLAQQHGVSRTEYLDWMQANHNVQCTAITRRGLRCKHIIKYGVDAQTFAQMRNARCIQH